MKWIKSLFRKEKMFLPMTRHIIDIKTGYPLPDGQYETSDGIKFEIITT